MSSNKKQFGIYSSGRVSYNLDGSNAAGKKLRAHKQSLFTCGTAIVILTASIGIIYMLYLTGMVQMILEFAGGLR